MSDVRIPLREYLEEQEIHRREWMRSTFATKDDLAEVKREVSSIKGQRQAVWGAAGTFVGGLVVAVLQLFGVGPSKQ